MNFEIPDQKKIIDFYGDQVQSIVHCEELGELIQAISKVQRTKILPSTFNERVIARYNLIEEMADVFIILQQMIDMYAISEHEIQDTINKKCIRQEERLNA